MEHAIFFGTVAVSALLLALLEIQIEGGEGWAATLPTWRLQNRWTRLLYGGRPLTGYHLYIQLLVLVMVHLPYGLGFAAPSLAAEARILSFIILFWILEDFLWFAFNPAYGVRGFRRERVRWHAPAWWLIMPREYWVFTPIGLVLYALSWR